jgi:phospholipase/carboxylesterase
MLRYDIVEAGKALAKAEKAIIVLHGRGGNAEDVLWLAEAFTDDTYYIAAPQADDNSWYPYTFLAPEDRNEPWLSEAIQFLRKLADEISAHIPSEKLYLMGFSQGACLSLEFAARYASDYAGIAAFSGGLIGEKINTEKYKGDFSGTRIFIGNSDIDPHIPLKRTNESAEILKKLGAEVNLKIYPGMGHTIIEEELEEVRRMMF